MKKLVIGIAVALVATAGYCNQVSDNVAGMTEKARRNFTGMLVRQTGAECSSVQRTFLQGTIDTTSTVWNVSCGARDSYGIVFVDDTANTVRVMKCAQLPTLGTPACFKKITK